MAQIKDLIVTGASRFLGNIYGTLKGNADTSTKATQDSAGQQINTTYIKGLSVSGRTITYTKGDGKTGTITTQDNNTTYTAGTGLSLSGTTFNHKNSVTAATAQGDANKTLTFGGTFTIPTITYDAQGHITSKGTTTMTMPANPNTDTHWTTGITAGETGTISNSATTNGNTFIKIKDNSTHRGQIKLVGSGATSVSSNAEGVITISSTDNNTTYGSMSVSEGTTGTATTNRVLTAANLKGIINAHAPTKTGGGASGTWGISISGNAATASKVNNKLTVGSKSYDGSAAVTIEASDLGLASAMLFLGTTTTAITDGATTNPVAIGGSNKTVTAGNVVLYGSKEFVWTGSAWEELGNEGSYKIVQAAVADPSASGTSNTFIDTISQDTNGKITATKKTVAVTNSAPTLAWNTTSTIGTVAGTNLQVKMPANPNTDTKVTQTVTTSNAAYPLLLAPNGQTATTTTTSYFDSGVTLNPSTNTIAANVSGNATTATALTSSAGNAGQPIYFGSGKPVAIDWRVGNSDLGEHNCNNVTYNFCGYYNSNGPSTSIGASTYDGALYTQAYNSSWVGQIAQDYCNGGLYVRGNNNGTWQSWHSVLDTRNYTSYTVTKTGSGASGTWGISITGSSASCTGNAATAAYTTQLLGVDDSNNPYDATEDNLIRAVWNVNGDGRWYLKAKKYDCRVSCADSADNADKLDGYHFSDLENRYVNITGDTMSGDLTAPNVIVKEFLKINAWPGYGSGWGGFWYDGDNKKIYAYNGDGYVVFQASKVYGAVWNDYAEYRHSNITEPGRVVIENGDGTLSLSTERLQRGAEIISDTFGFAIGETNECKTPIAVSGRVLAYYSGDIKEFKPGYPVCSGPNGTVSVMTEEEEEKYPSRIIGTVSEIPTYEKWGTGNVEVNGRIWIRIR